MVLEFVLDVGFAVVCFVACVALGVGFFGVFCHWLVIWLGALLFVHFTRLAFSLGLIWVFLGFCVCRFYVG